MDFGLFGRLFVVHEKVVYQMVRKVYRYSLPIQDRYETTLEAGAKFLALTQSRFDPDGSLDVWFEVATDAPLVRAVFHVEGTGHDVAEGASYLGTAVMGSGHSAGLVWHLYKGV